MLYVQLDVNWVDHPKVMDVGIDGAGLHAMALCLAKRMETEGVLTRGHLRRVGADEALIDRLVDAGLLDVVDDARVRVHGWLDRNPSQGAIDASRTAKAASGREGNHRRWGHTGAVDNCARCNPPEPSANRLNPMSSQGATPTDRRCDECDSPETETETETEQEKTIARTPSNELALTSTNGAAPTAHGYPDDFETWWILYPRKLSKAQAAKAWKAARRSVDAQTLTDALVAQSAMWREQGRATEYIPHASSWLNGRRWEDTPDQPQPRQPRSWGAIQRVMAERPQ